MSRIAPFAIASILFSTCLGYSQDPAPPAEAANELHSIHQLLEQQQKQLDALAREIAQINLHLAGGTAAKPETAKPEGAKDEEPKETQEAPGEKPQTGAPTAANGEAAKAEPVTGPNGGLKHAIAKGETLTSIAKQYNVPVADLQKANKIHDERKLQIGQVLNIPTKTSESPTEKKETP